MQQKILYIVIGLAAGTLLTWTVMSQGTANYSGNMRGMMQNNPQMSQNNIDRHFIEQMIPHHEDAIVMGQLALKLSQRQEIKDLSQAIITAQSSEIDQMKNWYQEWFNTPVPDIFAGTHHSSGTGLMHGGMMHTEADIQALQNANPFDKAFIEAMIPHHQMAVMMAQMLKASSNRPEMKTLADNIITSQNAEINQMRDWYSQWYK